MTKELKVKTKLNPSEARKTDNLLKEYKKLFGKYQKLARFEPPILFLIRRTGQIEFYENAKSGEFAFKHSDGTDKNVVLTRPNLKFQYAGEDVPAYVIDEDVPFPLPQTPLIYIQQYQQALDKVMNDIMKHKAEETTALGALIWQIAKGVAIILAVFALFAIVAPNQFNAVLHLGSNQAENVGNMTLTTLQNNITYLQ